MNLEELVKKHFGIEGDKVTAFLEDMKANKVFVASEENLDKRYSKLKGDYDTLNNQKSEADKLIEQMKEATKGNEGMQEKITNYEKQIEDLTKQNNQLVIDNAIKFELLSKGAKASDIDYLMFKAKQGEELTLDKDGNVKGIDTVIETLQKTCSSNFDDKSKRKVEVLELHDDIHENVSITQEQFDKMGYEAKNKVFKENRELYNKLTKGE